MTGFCSATFRINCFQNAFASICVVLIQMLNVGLVEIVDSPNAWLLLLSALSVIQGADAIPPTPFLELIDEANKAWMDNILGFKIKS